jgi:hypothetical protein
MDDYIGLYSIRTVTSVWSQSTDQIVRKCNIITEADPHRNIIHNAFTYWKKNIGVDIMYVFRFYNCLLIFYTVIIRAD